MCVWYLGDFFNTVLPALRWIFSLLLAFLPGVCLVLFLVTRWGSSDRLKGGGHGDDSGEWKGEFVWQSGTNAHNLEQRWNLRALQSDRKCWLNSRLIWMTGGLVWPALAPLWWDVEQLPCRKHRPESQKSIWFGWKKEGEESKCGFGCSHLYYHCYYTRVNVE